MKVHTICNRDGTEEARLEKKKRVKTRQANKDGKEFRSPAGVGSRKAGSGKKNNQEGFMTLIFKGRMCNMSSLPSHLIQQLWPMFLLKLEKS